MLQQTQAPRVAPRFCEFVDRWPTPTAFAGEPLGEVLRAWQGLGYPRRARYLHLAAQQIVDDHAGAVPATVDELLTLPGVGAYTARAVLAFAFEQDIGVVDTNVARVLARVDGRRLTPRAAQRLADTSVPAGRSWWWNQSLMELGAVVCRPAPRCDACPIARSCLWARGDRRSPDPAVGSAGVSKAQRRFEGSRRQQRGVVMRSVADGPRPVSDFDRSIVEELCVDGLIEFDGQSVRLPI
ncbi:MAG: A/G-specific adenine glycosylase [Actinomycetota bacterium]